MRSNFSKSLQENSYVVMAIDFDLKIRNPLNSAASIFMEKLGASEAVVGHTSFSVRSREPRWQAVVTYTRVQFAALPLVFFLESSRDITSCFFNATNELGVSKIRRLGISVSSWRPMPGVEYSEFAQSAAEHCFRSPLLQCLSLEELDGSMTLEGRCEKKHMSFSIQAATMSPKHVQRTLESSPVFSAFKTRETCDDVIAGFSKRVIANSIHVEIDVSKNDITTEDIRDSFFDCYEAAENRSTAIAKYFGITEGR